MNSGPLNIISEDEVIASTKMALRLTDTADHDNYLSLLINEAIRHCAPYSIYKKRQCTLDIENNACDLPKGFVRLLGARYKNTVTASTDPSVVTATNNCFQLLYADVPFLNSCGCNTSDPMVAWYGETFQIVGSQIHFNSDIAADKIDIAFFGLNVDDEGRIYIYEDYERALRAYACWKFSQTNWDKYQQGIIESYRSEWVAQKSWVRGTASAAEFQKTKREVQLIFNALLVSREVNY